MLMKLFRNRQVSAFGEPAPATIDRRKLVLGAGTAGVAAVAVQALRPATAVVPAVEVSTSALQAGDGYQITPHVLRYYETAKV
jgi:hypothetical protein